MKIEVMKDILGANDAIAEQNRQAFKRQRVLVMNLMSSPGSGKTSLLERTVEALRGKVRVGVIEGDIESTKDSERLAKYEIPVVQINTKSLCHLDANLLSSALKKIRLKDIDVLFIENVGNLVCPANFSLGEDYKVMLLSVTEGDEKPLKYPLMFREADVLIINKMDLLKHTNFDVKEAEGNALKINPSLKVFRISCAARPQGLKGWLEWLMKCLEAKKKA